jgi:hypothetical protein
MKGKRPTTPTVAILSVLAALALTTLPAAFASPITATLAWTPNPNPVPGSAETGTATVKIDSDCPAETTYAGVITITTPGAGVSTHIVAPTACGSPVVVSYPADFTGVASTAACGAYKAEWAGTTSTLIGGLHPAFDLKNLFVVSGCSRVPEFSSPALMIAAIGLALVAAVKRGRLLKV